MTWNQDETWWSLSFNTFNTIVKREEVYQNEERNKIY